MRRTGEENIEGIVRWMEGLDVTVGSNISAQKLPAELRHVKHHLTFSMKVEL